MTLYRGSFGSRFALFWTMKRLIKYSFLISCLSFVTVSAQALSFENCSSDAQSNVQEAYGFMERNFEEIFRLANSSVKKMGFLDASKFKKSMNQVHYICKYEEKERCTVSLAYVPANFLGVASKEVTLCLTTFYRVFSELSPQAQACKFIGTVAHEIAHTAQIKHNKDDHKNCPSGDRVCALAQATEDLCKAF